MNTQNAIGFEFGEQRADMREGETTEPLQSAERGICAGAIAPGMTGDDNEEGFLGRTQIVLGKNLVYNGETHEYLLSRCPCYDMVPSSTLGTISV
jgi:hypothetical protein